MTTIGFSLEECISSLRLISEQINEIIVMFDDHGFIDRENKENAQNQLKRLKEMLHNNYHIRDTLKGNRAMTKVEKAFFYPAIHEALTKINVKTNSQPAAKWVMELLDAQDSINFYLCDLERIN